MELTQARIMEIHKSYWIGLLRTKRENKITTQFVKDLGKGCTAEAVEFLENCPQTTFVGCWFLTDEELETERDRAASGKVSVFDDTSSTGTIRILADDLHNRLEELEENCGGLMRLLGELSRSAPEDHKRIIDSLSTLVSWSAELGTARDGLSDRGQTAYILLELIENNSEDPVNLLVLFQLTQIFVDYMQGSIWATGKGFNNPNIVGDA